jgi:hypothetical protein
MLGKLSLTHTFDDCTIKLLLCWFQMGVGTSGKVHMKEPQLPKWSTPIPVDDPTMKTGSAAFHSALSAMKPIFIPYNNSPKECKVLRDPIEMQQREAVVEQERQRHANVLNQHLIGIHRCMRNIDRILARAEHNV